jgi:hypothetical protein
MAEPNYTRLVSLGRGCDCAHQIRRFTGIESASYFDWLATPHSALVKVLRLRFDGCFAQENLVVAEEDTTVRDDLTGLHYHHNFSRSADKKTIAPSAIEREYERESAKMSFLARRWFETIRNETVLFVRRDTPTVPQALELYQALEEQVPDRPTSLLFVIPPGYEFAIDHPRIFAEPCMKPADDAAWYGDDEAWNGVLGNYWHPRGPGRRDPYLAGPRDPDRTVFASPAPTGNDQR